MGSTTDSDSSDEDKRKKKLKRKKPKNESESESGSESDSDYESARSKRTGSVLMDMAESSDHEKSGRGRKISNQSGKSGRERKISHLSGKSERGQKMSIQSGKSGSERKISNQSGKSERGRKISNQSGKSGRERKDTDKSERSGRSRSRSRSRLRSRSTSRNSSSERKSSSSSDDGHSNKGDMPGMPGPLVIVDISDFEDSGNTGRRKTIKTKDGKFRTGKTASQAGKYFISKLSAHAVQVTQHDVHLYNNIFWGIVFVIGLGATGYLLYVSLTDFLQLKPIENTFTEYREQAEFPAVTICNLNKLARSQLTADFSVLATLDDEYGAGSGPGNTVIDPGHADDTWWQNEETSKFKFENGPSSAFDTSSGSIEDINGKADPFVFDKSEYFSTLSGSRDFRTMGTFAKARDRSSMRRWANPTNTELDTMAQPLSTLMLLCSFNGATCTASDFSKVYDRELGLCYTFNKTTTGPTLTSTSGYQAGLRLTLNIKMSEYLGLLAPTAGVAVVVHDDGTHPFPDKESYLAGVERDTAIGVQAWTKKHVNLLSSCLTAAPTTVPLHYSGSYSAQNCRRSCLLQTIQSQCSCSDDITATETAQCLLTNRSQVLCRQKVRYMYAHRRLICQQQCLPACNQKAFYTSYSTAQLPSTPYSPILDKISGVSSVDNTSLLRVHVYMKTLDEVIIDSDLAYPLYRMLCDVGGALALFVGLSLCTIVELLEFLLELLCLCCAASAGCFKNCCVRMHQANKARIKKAAERRRQRRINVKPPPPPPQPKPKPIQQAPAVRPMIVFMPKGGGPPGRGPPPGMGPQGMGPPPGMKRPAGTGPPPRPPPPGTSQSQQSLAITAHQ